MATAKSHPWHENVFIPNLRWVSHTSQSLQSPPKGHEAKAPGRLKYMEE